ncbi:MAG: UDP-N-acetylglucosamine 1-carboxyvinyltransferase [Acidobacteriota bacterium]
MSQFVIQGGKPLRGTVAPIGNKNAALPLMAASLLTSEPIHLSNVPDIADVRVMLAILEEMGVSVRWDGPSDLTLHAHDAVSSELPDELTRRIRASILFVGPLLARTGSVTMPPPGGDVIGRRRLDSHFHALGKLGAEVEMGARFRLLAPSLEGTEIFLDEASVTATENALMAATLARGRTILWNAACEPHVQDLAELLVSMGARIQGAGTNRIVVDGVSELGGASHRIQPDHVEIGSFVGLAAVTGGEITIQGVAARHLQMILQTFGKMGLAAELRGTDLIVPEQQALSVRYDLGGAIPQIEDGPWPAFPSDLMSIALVVATQASGTVLFFEKMFESRMYFVDSLISLGARIVLCDPHRAVVVGPSPLYGGRVVSPDIRAGMALLLAALAAQGETVIENIAQIDRGYERIDEKIRALGGRIERRPNPEG